MPRCYSYIRFSSKKQEQGDSIRRQIFLRDQWISKTKGCFLDDSINLHDYGLSAYSGDNLDPARGNLGKFIELCRQGKIEKDSFLILERVDRFSRKSVFKVVNLLQELIDYGLKIVVLEPSEIILDETNITNIEIVIQVVLFMQLAYEQSREKSKRIGEAWRGKRQEARKKQIITKRIPAWLLYDEKEKTFKIKDRAAEAITFIFEQAANGVGQTTITRRLNANFDPIVERNDLKPKHLWNNSYVNKILHNRSVLGFYQPMKFDDRKNRIPDGDPIEDYFPRIISDELFIAARVAISGNKRIQQNHGDNFLNIFRKLIFSSDGHSMQINTTRARGRKGSVYTQKRLVSYGNKRNSSSCPFSIEYDAFEEFILAGLKELNPDDLVDSPSSITDIQHQENQLRLLKQQNAALKDQINDPRNISILPTLSDALSKNEDRINSLELKIASSASSTNLSSKEIRIELSDLLAKNSTDNSKRDIRYRLSKLLPTIIERIDVHPMKFRNGRVGCIGTITLRSGSKRKIKFKKNINKRWYAITDSKNTIVSLTTYHGWIFYERGEQASEANITNSTGSGKTKYQKGTEKPTNEEISSDFKKMAVTFREEFLWNPS